MALIVPVPLLAAPVLELPALIRELSMLGESFETQLRDLVISKLIVLEVLVLLPVLLVPLVVVLEI